MGINKIFEAFINLVKKVIELGRVAATMGKSIMIAIYNKAMVPLLLVKDIVMSILTKLKDIVVYILTTLREIVRAILRFFIDIFSKILKFSLDYFIDPIFSKIA